MTSLKVVFSTIGMVAIQVCLLAVCEELDTFLCTLKARIAPLFRILTADDFQTSPWKNGGGITHEIARRADGDGWHWRLSIAEIGADGPFSLFSGMSRILTVIEGRGIDLRSAQGVLEARLHGPVHFSGDLDVSSHMVDGPVRNLNLIYDADLYEGAMQVTSGPNLIECTVATVGFLCLSGAVTVAGDGLPVGAFALGTGGTIEIAPDAIGILVALRELS